MREDTLLPIVILTIVFTTGIIISLGVTWLQNRPKMRMIDVLRAYAEKGEEPPTAVVEALSKINWPFPPPPPSRPPTRSDHLAHMAGSIGLAIGAGLVILWRWPLEYQHPGWILITAIFVAIFFAAAAAARLAWALTFDDGRR